MSPYLLAYYASINCLLYAMMPLLCHFYVTSMSVLCHYYVTKQFYNLLKYNKIHSIYVICH